MPDIELKSIPWESLKNAIKKQRCVLFLGPELSISKNGKPITEQLLKHIDYKNNRDILYYPSDELFLFRNNLSKVDTYEKMEAFFNNIEPSGIYEQIAQLPFHLIISFNTDNFLKRAFGKLGLDPTTSFFNKKAIPEKDVQPPTLKSPLVYNLLGSIDEMESLILSHDDMYDYINVMLTQNPLPQAIKNVLFKGGTRYIMLGFKFEKWYVQLLLRILQLHKKDVPIAKNAASKNMDNVSEEIKSFCFDQFNIEFIPNDIDQFVTQLYNECDKDGLLRSSEFDQGTVAAKIKYLVSQNKIPDAIKELKNLIKDPEYAHLEDEVIMIESSLSTVLSEQQRMVISNNEFTLRMNQIKDKIIGIALQL